MIINQQPPSSGGGGGATHTVTCPNGGTGRGLLTPTVTADPDHGREITTFEGWSTEAQYEEGQLVIIGHTSDFMIIGSPNNANDFFCTVQPLGNVSGIKMYAFVMPDTDIFIRFASD